MSFEVLVGPTSILRIVVRSKGQMSFEVPGYQTSILHIVVRSGDNVIGGIWRSNKHPSYCY